MGRLSRSRTVAHGFGIFEDTSTGPGHHASMDAISVSNYNHLAVLEDCDTNNGRGTPDFIDSLTAKLKKLHIYSPKKNRADRSLLAPVRHHLSRLSVDTKIAPTLRHIREEAEYCNENSTVSAFTQGPLPGELPRKTKQDEGIPSSTETRPFSIAPFLQTLDSLEASEPAFCSQVLHAAKLEHHIIRTNSDIQTSIARHKAGQYDYALSVLGPDSSAQRNNLFDGLGDLTLNFGCNVLVHADRARESACNQGKPANTYKILATLLGTEDVAQHTPRLSGETEVMAVAEPVVRLVSPTPVREEAAMNKSAHSGVTVPVVEQARFTELSMDFVDHPKDRVVSTSTDEGSTTVDEAPRTPSRSTSSSSRSRIEDSVEAIDKLEEELEAVNIAARMATPRKSRRVHVMTDDSTTTSKINNTVIKRTASTLKRTQSIGAGAKPAQSQTAQRKSASTTDNDVNTSPGKQLERKPTVNRPTSLLPPKPPVKSTKPPTKPYFELPGEAVARRIKEQREARLAQQAQEKASAPATPKRTRSLKVPTRPNFELPGEAISQRKRAEREARLKAQEEEERKRREFKARPIKAKLASAACPRETATSRARQNKGSEVTDGQVKESLSKRTSMLSNPYTPVRTSSTRSSQTRGRGTVQTETLDQASRATSTSTGSMSGKRSTLSVEELEQQKLKGREIFQRDNCYIEDKERERREREWNTKMAREQAAERSRQAGRQWAEKQRRKQLAAVGAMAGQAA